MLTYDAEVDALYASFREIADGEVARSRKLTRRTILDLDVSGEPIGVELLWVSEGVDLEGVPHADDIMQALDRLPRSQPAA